MTTERSTERLLQRWLVDGVDEMPERVYLSILDRVERQPQRRAWRVSWRDSHVNSYLKPLTAIAAIVLVAVAGIAVLGGPSGSNVGGPVASPSLSPSPVTSVARSPQASATALPCASDPPPGCAVGELAAGTYTSRAFQPPISYTVPAGWENDGDWPEWFALNPDAPGDVQVNVFPQANAGALGICAGTISQGSDADTASDIAEVLAASEGLATTEPVPVTFAGLSGQQLDTRLGPGWDGTCSDSSDQSLAFEDIRQRLIVLDTPSGGNVVIVLRSIHSADFEALLEAAMPVVESFEFDLSN